MTHWVCNETGSRAVARNAARRVGERAVTDPVSVRRALAQSGLVPVDAQVLMAHILGRNRAWLAAHGDDLVPRTQADAFFALARRRREGEPVAYLTGTREFWGLPLAVSAAVLIPRPETEAVVEIALSRLPADREARVLDLGTGCGAIALAIAHERPRAQLLATDVSLAALAVARDNAQRLGIANVEFLQSDWYADVPQTWRGGLFDVIASNPPYIVAGDPHLADGDLRHEPAGALSPGGDGLAAFRRIVDGARERLAPGGTLVVEHGFDQADAVRALFDAAGFIDILAKRDLAGIPRVVAGRMRDE
jgi:release factor glutamine methyltransferase